MEKNKKIESSKTSNCPDKYSIRAFREENMRLKTLLTKLKVEHEQVKEELDIKKENSAVERFELTNIN